MLNKEFIKASMVRKFNSNPTYAKMYEWGKLVTITGVAQIIVQLAGLICGIMIIRFLSPKEYGLYTLVNTMLGTMAIIADGGIVTGVMAEGGKVWEDRKKLGVVISTGLDLRKIFGIVSLAVAIPPLLYLLLNHGATWLMSVLIILSLIPAFFASMSDTMLEVAPKLKQDIKALQKNQLQASIGRLALTGITIFIFPWAFIAILAGGLPRIWANIFLKKISVDYADLSQKPEVKVKKQILSFVKRIMPGAIYYSISGQITIWLISIFGTTSSIAQIGALGRLTMVLSIVSTLFTSLIVPRFAKLPEIRQLLFKRYIAIILILFSVISIIVGICWLFPDQILWILGKSYSGLSKEFLFVVVAACLNLIAGISFSLNSNRGWIFNPIIGIGIGLTEIFLGIMLFNISTLQGVLYFNLFQASVGLLLHPSFGMFKILKLSKYGREQAKISS